MIHIITVYEFLLMTARLHPRRKKQGEDQYYYNTVLYTVTATTTGHNKNNTFLHNNDERCILVRVLLKIKRSMLCTLHTTHSTQQVPSIYYHATCYALFSIIL